MAAPPLRWKEGEGYDIHLLRGGPASKRLIDALDLDSGQAASVTFIPNCLGGTDRNGVEVDVHAGIVKALPHPDPAFPRLNNFRLEALFQDPGGARSETDIRVHLHDSVKDIWLTPSTLTIHQGADECRFTVLARFNDDVVGDITDWPQLTYQSADLNVVKVLGGGVLQAAAPGGRVPITVNLTVPSLGINKTSAPATALTRPSWADVARAAKVSFVAGARKPDENNPTGPEPDSVRSVVEHATNILFVSEGFRHEQRFDFRNIVNRITYLLRSDEFAPYFQPFNLLKHSINYWVVFVPSEQDGISLLGEYMFTVQTRLIGALLLPQEAPAPDAESWNFLELIHEVGLPVQADAGRPLADLVADWRILFGDHVTVERATNAYTLNWKVLPFHSPLNERDSAFGLTVGDRPRASRITSELVTIGTAEGGRRTSDASIEAFVGNLTYGGYPIGSTWKTGGKDFGLTCFICHTDRGGGTETSTHFFAATTGRRLLQVNLKVAANSGLDAETPPVAHTQRTLLASLLAHEAGHAVGDLGDEYGSGTGSSLVAGPGVPFEGNVQGKGEITTTVPNPPPGTPATVYNKTKEIKWLWSRLSKAGVLEGTPTPAGTGFQVKLRKGHGKSFRPGDVVRIREWPVWLPAWIDLFSDTPLKVKAAAVDEVTVERADPSTPDLDLGLFQPDKKYALICPRTAAGAELTLVAEPIRRHIESSNGPLNAPRETPTVACSQAASSGSVMTPTNLPPLSRTPRTRADIIGIYEGGSGHDCGVFRPAGRCKMRDDDITTIPFCHVCRYLIVERVDPTRHGDLDKLYPEVSP